MAFHESQFPTDISYGSRGGPAFNTSIVVLGSGYEQRNINWANSRCEYDVAYGVTTDTQLTALIAFFRARFGRAHGFRYKDWADYICTLQVAVLLTAKTYQITKVYTSGSGSYSRALKKIVANTTHVFKDSVEMMSGWSVVTTTGVITFDDAPGASIITVTCQFDVPVRFDTDKLSTSLENYNAAGTYFGGASVPLIEIRV